MDWDFEIGNWNRAAHDIDPFGSGPEYPGVTIHPTSDVSYDTSASGDEFADYALFNPTSGEGDVTEVDEIVVIGKRPTEPTVNPEDLPGDDDFFPPPVTGGGGGQIAGPLGRWGFGYVMDAIADWIVQALQPEPARFDNFDPDRITHTQLNGDRVLASTDNGQSWYVDLNRSAADGWEAHVRFDEYGLPWVDLGDGRGYRLAPVPSP